MSAKGIKEKILKDVSRLAEYCDDLERQLKEVKFTNRQLKAENERLQSEIETREAS